MVRQQQNPAQYGPQYQQQPQMPERERYNWGWAKFNPNGRAQFSYVVTVQVLQEMLAYAQRFGVSEITLLCKFQQDRYKPEVFSGGIFPASQQQNTGAPMAPSAPPAIPPQYQPQVQTLHQFQNQPQPPQYPLQYQQPQPQYYPPNPGQVPQPNWKDPNIDQQYAQYQQQFRPYEQQPLEPVPPQPLEIPPQEPGQAPWM